MWIYPHRSYLTKLKLNTGAERDKLRYAIWKEVHNISRSINSVFHHHYRDSDIIHINILSLLLQFSVISIRQIEELGGFHHRCKTIIFKLEEYGCVKIYFSNTEEYSSKKEILPDLYEKGLIIESLGDIEELFNGAVIDMKKCEKIEVAKRPRKRKIPYGVNNKVVIVEITDKGRLLLKRYRELYSRFFNIQIENLTIDKNILGLYAKSITELKKMVNKDEYDVLALMIQRAHNRKNSV